MDRGIARNPEAPDRFPNMFRLDAFRLKYELWLAGGDVR